MSVAPAPPTDIKGLRPQPWIGLECVHLDMVIRVVVPLVINLMGYLTSFLYTTSPHAPPQLGLLRLDQEDLRGNLRKGSLGQPRTTPISSLSPINSLSSKNTIKPIRSINS